MTIEHVMRERAERLLHTLEAHNRELAEEIEGLDEERDLLTPGTATTTAISQIVTAAERARLRLRHDIGRVRTILTTWAPPEMPPLDFSSIPDIVFYQPATASEPATAERS